MSLRHRFIQGLPVCEGHIHIEGSLEPEMTADKSIKNNIPVRLKTASGGILENPSVEDIRRAYDFRNLQEFLDIYYQGMGVLQTRADFRDLTAAYLQKAATTQNVIHSNIFFDPQGHTDRGVKFETVVDGIADAMTDGEKEFGISSNLIMCFLRHLPEESALDTLEQAHPYRRNGTIFGVGLDSSEMGHPPSKFKRTFTQAGREGYFRTAHAAEEGPPAYVWEALDELGVEQIDHGNRSLEDPVLVARLRRDQVPMTVCPLSNLRLGGIKDNDMRNHQLLRMMEAGLNVAGLHSDDPAYFLSKKGTGGYVKDSYIAVADALDITNKQLVTLAANSLKASHMPEREMRAALQRLDAYVRDFNWV